MSSAPACAAVVPFALSIQEGAFEGRDGVRIFRRSWLPDGPRRGVLVLVHGMSEHSGRYDHVARLLAGRGVAVHAMDHRGHGRSGGEIGTVESFDHYLDDLAEFVRIVGDEEPAVPFVMLGHSMGGLIASAFVLERRPLPDFLVLSGPAIVPILQPGDRRVDPTRLTRDPAMQQAYLDDPLVLRERVREELYYRLVDGLALLVGRAAELSMPVLLLHGTDDPLCSAEGAEAWVRSSSSPDATVRLYPGGRHEMFNEVNRDEVLTDLWSWLDARLPR